MTQRRGRATLQPMSKTTLALLGGTRHTGTIHGSRTLVAVIGGMDLDLGGGVSGDVTITKVSLIGGVDLTVPAGVLVEVHRFVLFGGKDVERDAAAGPDAPLVRVRAFGLVGGVRVRVAR